MSFLQVHTEQPSIQPDIIFALGNLGITNAMIMGVFVTLFFGFIAVFLYDNLSLVPRRGQSIIEMIVEAIIGLLEQITGSRAAAKTLLPIIGTLFLFFGVSNIITLIPGLSSITYDGVSILRTPTNDFNMTFSVALAMVILTHVASLKQFGVLGHIGKFIKVKGIVVGFRQGVGAGFMAIIDFLLGLLDIISEGAKVISLSLRLFGNMYAGEVLAGILMGSLAILVPAPWVAMNLLVGILQALVFGALTAAYYALAVQKEDAAVAEQA